MTDIEHQILLPGCCGNHASVVTFSLDILHQHCSEDKINRICINLLDNAASNNSIDVIPLLFQRAHFEIENLLGAISLACQKGHAETVLLLLENYPRMNYSRRCGRQCFVDIFYLLASKRLDEDPLFDVLDFGLYIATLRGNYEVAKLLIKENVDVNVEFEENSNPLWEESSDLLVDIAQPILWHRSLQAAFKGITNKYGFYSGGQYIASNLTDREATILLLLENGAKVNNLAEDSEPLFITAVKHCSVSIVQSMINKVELLVNDPSARLTALQVTARREKGTSSVMKAVLQAGGFPESDLKLALNAALELFENRSTRSYTRYGRFRELKTVADIFKGDPGTGIMMLLQMLPTEKVEDARYSLLLQMAVAANNRECMDLLLEREIDISAQGNYYGNALQCAARCGHLDLVKLLLSRGADVNVVKGELETAIRAAVVGEHEEVVAVLLEHSADVNLRSSERCYGLDSASILNLALR